MVAALHDGRLSGAALDVTDPEPLPEGDPLWAAPNTIITPHISGITTDYTDRSFQVLEKNLERLEKGEPLINVLDREKGY
jgi:phosphoglycerate dehydrogenase-like enzyme